MVALNVRVTIYNNRVEIVAQIATRWVKKNTNKTYHQVQMTIIPNRIN